MKRRRTGATKLFPSEHVAYRHMIRRCTSPKAKNFDEYGARGIKVCQQWLESFDNFLMDVGCRPPGTTLDRRDPNGHYEPNNCRWATAQEQAANRRYCHKVVLNGREMTIQEAAREAAIPPMTLRNRVLKQKLPIEKAVQPGPVPFRRDSKHVTHNGMTLSVPEWAKKVGVHVRTLRERLRRGTPLERALGPLLREPTRGSRRIVGPL